MPSSFSWKHMNRMQYCLLSLNTLTKAQAFFFPFGVSKGKKKTQTCLHRSLRRKEKNLNCFQKSWAFIPNSIKVVLLQHHHTLNRLIISGSSVNMPATRVWLDTGTGCPGKCLWPQRGVPEGKKSLDSSLRHMGHGCGCSVPCQELILDPCGSLPTQDIL